MAAVASKPPISGICTSISTRSKVSRSSAASASRPLLATVTAWPRLREQLRRATRWLTTLSSASSTFTRRTGAASGRDGRGGAARTRRGRRGRAVAGCSTLADGVEQIGRVDRLGEIGGDPELAAAGGVAVLPGRGQHHDRRAGQLGTRRDLLGDPEAVLIRACWRRAARAGTAGRSSAARASASSAAATAGDGRRHHAPPRDLLLQDAPVDRVVVDDEHRQLRQRRLRRRRRRQRRRLE